MPRVFLNPGHAPNGQPDPGACGNGLRESDVTKAVTDLVAKYLTGAGVEVAGNLQDDSLAAIVNAANSSGADLFISVHCNSAAAASARGTETFSAYGSVNGEKLAKCIQAQIVGALGTLDRGAKTAGYYVIKYTDMTAVLVELAFISNSGDAALLRDKQDDFARAIARGVTDYIGGGQQAQPTQTQPGMLSEHFAASEFACHHCGQGGDKISPRLVELLEQLRHNIGGYPLTINSGYRCPVHNKNVGGVSNSTHVQGTAADVACPSQLTFDQFKWYVDQIPFDGVGHYPPGKGDFIHCDVRNGGKGGPGNHIYW